MEIQTKNSTPKETWKNICCPKCWSAQEAKCTCKCKGTYHGHGVKGYISLENFFMEGKENG